MCEKTKYHFLAKSIVQPVYPSPSEFSHFRVLEAFCHPNDSHLLLYQLKAPIHKTIPNKKTYYIKLSTAAMPTQNLSHTNSFLAACDFLGCLFYINHMKHISPGNP